ncbi:unnamed protein product [Camellia sinensis]
MINMNYDQRLIAAAKFVFAADSRAGHSPVNPADFGVTATLKPHQIEGLSWLIQRYQIGVNVILDGTGENFASYFFLELFESLSDVTCAILLVLCPLSVTDGWVSEVANFAPSLRVLRYVGEKDHRRYLRRKMSEHVKEQSSQSDVLSFPFDVLLTTYDIALMDQDFLSQIPWHYAIIDEAQRLKNPSSQFLSTFKKAGDPLSGNQWLPQKLEKDYGKTCFNCGQEKTIDGTGLGHDAAEVKGLFKILKYILGAFMLRRTKSKLIDSGTLVLPPLTEITVMAPLVNLQKKVYMSILRKELPRLLAFSSGASNHQSLQNIVMQLRKTCSHPYLFPGIEPEPYEEGEHLVQASGKLIILDQLLKKLHDTGHRVLLFAQMTHTLDILQDFMELRKYSYERLDGSIRAEERFAAIRSFSQQSVKGSFKPEADQSGAFIFMISTRAGGVGLNLVAADTVIFYEQDWNPQVDKQALQRAHRIGQINHVLCINLVTGQTVEEVILRRAEKKLQLSHNVVGEDLMDHEGKETTGAEAGDLRSVIFGLNMLDPTEMSNEQPDLLNMSELHVMVEKVIALRYKQQSDKDDRKFEVNPMDLLNGHDLVKKDPTSVAYPGFDEASYLSWVEKFKEASESRDSPVLELGNRRNLPEEKQQRAEAARKNAEEKKVSKWEALGYHSLSVNDPICPPNGDMMSDSGSVHFVYGDCTRPSKICPSDPAIIFSCVDDSGNWGHGGMFDALEKLSASVSSAYHRASEFKDLHLGDLHLIEIEEDHDEQTNYGNAPQWVALAVVQSYNPKRKVPRSNISVPDLERCLLKASFSAAQNSASIHMPRIGYQDGSDRSEWYTVERLLRKYAALYGIKIFVLFSTFILRPEAEQCI